MSEPEDVRAIELLQRSYARLSDASRWHEVAALFTDDATYARPSDPGRLIVGRAAILQSFLARPAGPGRRHLIANPEVELLGPDTARARCDSVMLVDHGDGSGTITAGGFDDRLRRTPEGWRFQSRRGWTTVEPVACTLRKAQLPDWATPAGGSQRPAAPDSDPQPPK